jgi:hypothetical protein
MMSLAAEPTLEEPLRVLVPGNISAAKGGALIASIAELDTDRDIEFHVLGAVDATLREPRPGVVLHGRYERDGFADHVRAIEPHLGAVLSIWPETYCHTLTECWAAGLPVLGTRLGAVAERIGEHGGGWLVAHDADPAEILALLQALKRDAAKLRAQRDAVRAWQAQTGRHHDAAAMATAYDLLYRGLLEARRSFAAAAAAPAARSVLLLDRGRPGGPFRLPLALCNRTDRSAVMRSALPSHPFGDRAAGLADAVVIPAGAIRLRDLPDVLRRAAAAGLALLLEVDDAMAEAVAAADAPPRGGADAAGAALRRILTGDGAPLVLAATEPAAMLLRGLGITTHRVDAALDPVAWLGPAEAEPRHAGTAPAGMAQLLCFADDPGLPALGPMLNHLAALGVANVVTAGTTPLATDGVAAFRAWARGCNLMLLAAPPAIHGLQPERALAAAAAGLVVLRGAEPAESSGETTTGEVLLPAEPEAWLRAIAELAVDPARCAMLAARGRARARDALGRWRWPSGLDALLLAHPGPAAPATGDVAAAGPALLSVG